METKEYCGWLAQDEVSLASRFGCTVDQLRAHRQKNANVLRDMLKEAEASGKKVNGYTAAKLSKMVADADALARGEQVAV